MTDAIRKEFLRPWMAGGIVALLGPKMPIKNLRNWTNRGYINDIANPIPGKYNPILYSLSSAFQAHGIQQAKNSGYATQTAILIGKKIKEYILYLIENGKIDLLTTRTDFEFTEDIMIFLIGSKKIGTWITQSETVSDLLLHKCDIFPVTSGTPAHGSIRGMFHIGTMTKAIVENYFEMDEKINQMAIEGRLKPFPKSI